MQRVGFDGTGATSLITGLPSGLANITLAVPEPSGLVLACVGMLGALLLVRRRKGAQQETRS